MAPALAPGVALPHAGKRRCWRASDQGGRSAWERVRPNLCPRQELAGSRPHDRPRPAAARWLAAVPQPPVSSDRSWPAGC